jgi:uncharacterized protein (TIRG00374 family)
VSHFAQYKKWYALALRYVLGILIISWLINTDLIATSVLSKINFEVVIFCTLLIFLQMLLSGYRIQCLLREYSIRVSLPRCIAYNSVGIFYSLFLPGGMSGDLVRGYYYWRACPESNKSSLIGALFMDRFLGTVVMIVMGLLAGTWLMVALGLKYFIFVSWLGFFLLVVGYWLVMNFRRNPNDITNVYIRRLYTFIEKIDLKTYKASTIFWALALSFFAHLLSVLVLFSCSELMQSGLDFLTVLAVAPLGFLANALPLTPGGLGVGEKGFDVLFSLVGGAEGANSFLLARIFLFAPALLGGITIIFHFIVFHKIVSPLK